MKILLADDSALVRAILKQVINEHRPDWKITGEASNGADAVKAALQLHPDIIICDLNMPVLNGMEAVEQIMAQAPAGIVIFSNEVDAASAFEALKKGALEVIRKPEITRFNEPDFIEYFFDTVTAAAGRFQVVQQHNATSTQSSINLPGKYQLLVIGASTGGPAALSELLPKIRKNFAMPILLVQHLESGFDRSFADWLDRQSSISVKLAQQDEKIQPGCCYIAPNDIHLTVSNNRIKLLDNPPVLNQKPSVDLLFSSAADQFGSRVLALIMTGMGRDGTDGCRKISQNGGTVLAQSRETCAVYGMPKAAVEAGVVDRILPLDQIVLFLHETVTTDE